MQVIIDSLLKLSLAISLDISNIYSPYYCDNDKQSNKRKHEALSKALEHYHIRQEELKILRRVFYFHFVRLQ